MQSLDHETYLKSDWWRLHTHTHMIILGKSCKPVIAIVTLWQNGTTLTSTYLCWHDKIEVRCLLRTMTSRVYYKPPQTSNMFSTMARLSFSCEFNRQNTRKCSPLNWSLSKHLKVWFIQLVVVVSHSNYECGCILSCWLITQELHVPRGHSTNMYYYREQTMYVHYFSLISTTLELCS